MRFIRSKRTPDERYDELVSEHVWPELRSRGFRRAGEDFHRVAGEAWEIVHFQDRPDEDEDCVKFTVKLASHPHEADAIAPPPLMHCSASMQLCEISGSERVWRDVDGRTNLRATAADVVSELEDHGFAWLTARAAAA